MNFTGSRWPLVVGLFLTMTTLRAAAPLPAPRLPPRVVLKTAPNDGRMLRVPPPRHLRRARVSNITILFRGTGPAQGWKNADG